MHVCVKELSPLGRSDRYSEETLATNCQEEVKFSNSEKMGRRRFTLAWIASQPASLASTRVVLSPSPSLLSSLPLPSPSFLPLCLNIKTIWFKQRSLGLKNSLKN